VSQASAAPGSPVSEPKRDSSYEWKAVLTVSLAFGLVGLDRFILPPLFPSMMRDLSLTYQDLGNLVGCLGIAWGVSAIVVGGLSDRLGRRKVLVPAVVIFSLLSVFSGMARAIIHNSDYHSLDAAKAVIDCHFKNRNEHFREHPKRAGRKIWGAERVESAFRESNNCKDPLYR